MENKVKITQPQRTGKNLMEIKTSVHYNNYKMIGQYVLIIGGYFTVFRIKIPQFAVLY